MRYFALAAMVAVTLALAASGQTTQRHRFFAVVNSTSEPPASQTTADGSSCAGVLEAKCPSQSSWTVIGTHPVDLECANTDGEVSYRESTSSTDEDVEWGCSITSSDAPDGAYRSTQIVTITGTLNACAASTLSAQSECEWHCRNEEGTRIAC